MFSPKNPSTMYARDNANNSKHEDDSNSNNNNGGGDDTMNVIKHKVNMLLEKELTAYTRDYELHQQMMEVMKQLASVTQTLGTHVSHLKQQQQSESRVNQHHPSSSSSSLHATMTPKNKSRTSMCHIDDDGGNVTHTTPRPPPHTLPMTPGVQHPSMESLLRNVNNAHNNGHMASTPHHTMQTPPIAARRRFQSGGHSSSAFKGIVRPPPPPPPVAVNNVASPWMNSASRHQPTPQPSDSVSGGVGGDDDDGDMDEQLYQHLRDVIAGLSETYPRNVEAAKMMWNLWREQQTTILTSRDGELYLQQVLIGLQMLADPSNSQFRSTPSFTTDHLHQLYNVLMMSYTHLQQQHIRY